MKRFNLVALIVLLTIILAVPMILQADTSVSPIVTATAPIHQKITISPADYTFADITETDYDTGYIEKTSAQALTLKSNKKWSVYVKTTSADMGTVEDYTKPISDFLWFANKGTKPDKIDPLPKTVPTPITNTDDLVAEGKQASGIGIDMDYKILLDWEKDVPGTYTITLVYTITPQP